MKTPLCLIKLWLGWLLLVSTASANFLITFTNSSKYNDEDVYVWFSAAGSYDLKKRNGEVIRLGHSYKLSELKSESKEHNGLVVNRFISGRIYISYGAPLPDSQPNPDGTPKRNPGVLEGDDGYAVRHDFMEFTFNPNPADVADLTSMDQFAIPIQLQLRKAGNNLSGPSTSAGWKKHSDLQVVQALKQHSEPVGANIQYDSQGNFIRIKGATKFPAIYQSYKDPTDSNKKHSLSQYLKQIYTDQAKGRKLVIDGQAFGKQYQYEALLVSNKNNPANKGEDENFDADYVLTRTGGDPSNPKVIRVPGKYKRGPNTADPEISMSTAILESNPWYKAGDQPLGPTQNDLSGAVVRDLFAALNLGYVNSEHKVAANETADPKSVGKAIHELTTSQMRELSIAFSDVNKYYNIYADAIRQLSDSYGYAYSDWSEHLTKVVVLMNAEHNGVKADELNIEILGAPITRSQLEGASPASQPENTSPARKSGYLDSVDDFLDN